MSDLSFEQLLEESLKTIHTGDVVDGKVIAVKEDEIILNIGYKADGIIVRNEYTNTPGLDLRTVVKEGDVIKAKVIRVNDGDGYVSLSYKRLAAELGNKRLEEAFENKEVLKAKVTQVLDGGVVVTVDEAKVFIPASLISDVYEKDLSKYANQEIEFVITEFNPRKRRIIGDRRQLVAAERAKLKEEALARLEVGQVVEGTVKNVTDFGVFIDLGGVDGLLHVSQISKEHIDKPSDVLSVGQEIEAKVVDINVPDRKISLSIKALLADDEETSETEESAEE